MGHPPVGAHDPVRELARAQVPDEPGVYLWRHAGHPAYVDMATSLSGRA